jgi:PHP family Zn ribbon phosphoesterase
VSRVEELGWNRDKTPYYVFQCPKCHQYSYVKTTQRAKKCPRCGRTSQVAKLASNAELVRGISSALARVKEQQAEFATRELGRSPLFHSKGEIIIAAQHGQRNHLPISQKAIFESEVRILSKTYKVLPQYLLDLIGDQMNLSKENLSRLIIELKREGKLHLTKQCEYIYISNQG